MTDSAGDAPDLGEETRRVVSAVQEWMRRVAERPAADPAHRHTSGPDCEWCPICQLAAVLRAERPELAERLGEAGAAVAAAVRAVIDAAVAHTGEPAAPSQAEAPRRRPRPRVEHIDLGGPGDGDVR